MQIGKHKFDTSNKTYIMGILNTTPDSFFDNFFSPDLALKRAEEMISEGADIIDVGGMSTRPGHTEISCEEELDRVIPIITQIRKNFDIPISIDTYRGQVALEALKAGADLVNDIWGALYDDGLMAKIIADNNVPCCLMHNSKTKASTVDEILDRLKTSIDRVLSFGVCPANIIIDPGIGFAKKDQNLNLRVIKELDRFTKLGYPILLGASRKSLIGHVLDLPGPERLEGTLAITAYGYLSTRLAFLRVHDVKENVRMIRMLEAISGLDRD